MRKFVKICSLILVVFSLGWLCGLFQQGQTLKENVIRLHVVANSDSEEDQALKLQVRDAVTENLQKALERIPTVEEARAYLKSHLQELEDLVNRVIRQAGFPQSATVTLAREEFGTRDYDTFSLPAGVYESLRITIGEGRGKNWWCVVFPSLCLPATSDGFANTAAGAGFDKDLSNTLQKKDGYEIRFFLLDVLGNLENLFHRR